MNFRCLFGHKNEIVKKGIIIEVTDLYSAIIKKERFPACIKKCLKCGKEIAYIVRSNRKEYYEPEYLATKIHQRA